MSVQDAQLIKAMNANTKSNLAIVLANLNQDTLADFFREYPVMAERCRVAIIIATEDEKRTEEETEAPFPHAEPI